MFRLMCKSRTRKIRRMIFSAMTAFAILVQALSVSFESDAASRTYVGGDILFDLGTGWTSDLVLSADAFNNSTNPYPSSSMSLYRVSRAGSLTLSVGDTLKVYFNKKIPADSWVNFTLYLLISYNEIASSSSFDQIHFSLNDPGVEYLEYSVGRNYFGAPSSQVGYFVNFHFFTSVQLEQLIFTDFGYYLSVSNNKPGSFGATLLHETYLYYSRDTDAYGDVLEQIEQNTGQTTDAINDQTQTVTEGYDNSQIVNDNQQLADSMQDYDDSQSAAVGDSTGYIDDVSFFDPSSSAQVMSGITLTGSFLQSLFENLGQWGAVVMVSLSLTFGLMLVGWFKFRK